jgi:hypothetical protein
MIFARPLIRLVLLTLVAVLASMGVTGAAASPPTSASGTFSYIGSSSSSCRAAGGNTICFDPAVLVTYTGTFSGTSIQPGTLTIHADGSANFHGVGTFTGTVNGTPGTVTLEANGDGTSTGQFEAVNVSTGGTGALANLHAVLDQVGTVGVNGPLGTYTGQIQFDAP